MVATFRKRRRTCNASERTRSSLAAVEADDELDANHVQDLRELQEMRVRRKGVQSDKVVVDSKVDNSGTATSSPNKSDGNVESNVLGLTRWAAAKQEVTEEENPHMLRYIQEKLASESETKPEAKTTDKHDILKQHEIDIDLYGLKRRQTQLAAHNGVDSRNQDAPSKSGDDVNGAPIAWNSGITEVELPAEFRMKNIAATERAKETLMKRQRKHDNRSSQHEEVTVTSNIAVNFRQIGREHAKKSEWWQGASQA